jgi:hypothetical protein
VLLADLKFLLSELNLLDSLFDLPVDHDLADLLPPPFLPQALWLAPLAPISRSITNQAAGDSFIGVSVAQDRPPGKRTLHFDLERVVHTGRQVLAPAEVTLQVGLL